MELSQLTPDEVVYLRLGPFALNATIVFTWALMAAMIAGCAFLTRRLTVGSSPSRWQTVLEATVEYVRDQIRAISGGRDPDRYVAFVGTLFLFIALSNALAVVPGWLPPTASLSTTAGLAIAVFVAVPVYAVSQDGMRPYLRQYLEPSPLMLPFNVIGDLSRTLALAVRLFGNAMSGVKIVAILLAVVPFFFPVVMSVLGLLTGLIQAYIFAVLAMVYIASALRQQPDRDTDPTRSVS